MRQVSLPWAACLFLLTTFVANAASATPAAATALAVKAQGLIDQVAEGVCDKPGLRAVVADPDFRKLPSQVKSVTYIGLVACIGGESTHDWLSSATAEPDAPPYAWTLRFLEDSSKQRYDDALANLDKAIRLSKATGQPVGLDRDISVFYLKYYLRNDPRRQRHFLADLDAMNWAPQDASRNPGSLWRDYSLRLLEVGQDAEAARVADKVTTAVDLFGMKLDKRFAAIVKADPKLFDIDRAAVAELERLQKLYGQAPQGAGADQIIEAMRTLGRFDEALTFADKTLTKPELLDDRGYDNRNWIEDRRALVLWDMGRFDEAIAAQRVAASRKEHGRDNVSQVINLADMLIDQGRFLEALEVVEPMSRSGTISPFGAGFVAGIRVCAYNGLSDEKAAQEAFAFVEAHVSDNRKARLSALLCANDTAGAAAHMIAWLSDPMDREEALRELSPAPDRPLAVFAAVLSHRFAKVRDDPAVVAAVARVGRTERLGATGAIWPTYPGA